MLLYPAVAVEVEGDGGGELSCATPALGAPFPQAGSAREVRGGNREGHAIDAQVLVLEVELPIVVARGIMRRNILKPATLVVKARIFIKPR